MSDRKDALVILTPGFPENEADSTCLPFLQDLVIELNEQFPKLKILVLAFDYPFYTGQYVWKGNKIISFNGWKKRKLQKIAKWIHIWSHLRKIKRNYHLTGLLSLWYGECAYIGSRFARRNQIPHYCWIQGQDAKKGNKFVDRIKPVAKELIALSPFIQREFGQNYHIRPEHIIPIGIRPESFVRKIAIRDIDIIGVGSLIPLKQYDIFLENICELKKQLPRIKVLLCGKGPEESTLLSLIDKYQLKKNITLTGELPHQKVLNYMSRSKVFMHTSSYEGLGVVCIEALYAGCHVLSFMQPMDYELEQWHIAESKIAMQQKALEILKDRQAEFKSIPVVTMTQSAIQLMQLYGYKEPIMS